MIKARKLSVLFLGIVLFGTSLLNFSSSLASESNISFVINGEKYVTPAGEPAPYVNKKHRTLVPVRFFADALDIKVQWDQASMTATLFNKAYEVKITYGENWFYVNGKTIYMDTIPEIKNGRIFIPARFIAQGFGAEIRFEAAKNTIHINLDPDTIVKKQAEPMPELDPYGRKIRTTNLPKNYADFEYILEEIPNEMYEMEYLAVRDPNKFRTPKDNIEYLESRELSRRDIDIWVDSITNYYDLILNVDYETIDYTWGDGLWEHMSKGVNEQYTRQKFRDYVDWVKENKIKIRGSVKPEPSITYYADSTLMRAQIEFEILEYNVNKNIIYDTLYEAYKDEIKKNQKYSGYFDVAVGSNYFPSDLRSWWSTKRVLALNMIFLYFQIEGIENVYRKLNPITFFGTERSYPITL